MYDQGQDNWSSHEEKLFSKVVCKLVLIVVEDGEAKKSPETINPSKLQIIFK